MQGGTSFVKKINTAPQLYKKQQGVKSYANQQYSISSGNQSLDGFTGGGFPIGSMVTLFQDSYSQFYAHFIKTYLGEGIVNEHKDLIIDPEEFRSKDHWLKLLPAVVKIKDPNQNSNEISNQQQQQQNNITQQEQLKVAWRYQSLVDEGNNSQQNTLSQGVSNNQLLYKFDNSKEMGNTISNSLSHQLKKTEYLVHLSFKSGMNFSDLWEKLCDEIQNNLSSEEDDRIFRILLPDFNQFLNANTQDEQIKQEMDLIRFLRNLKCLIRASNAVCLICFDDQLISQHLLNNVIFMSDSVFKLTSFKDQAEMTIGEYDGTIKILKQPKLHGLISHISEFDIYALKLKGKSGINVEKIHLEPEQDRSGQDENLQQKGSQNKGNKKQFGSTASVMCNQTKSHQLDF